MGLRVLVGIFVGFLFYILNASLGPFSMVAHVPPILAASLPIAMVVGLTLTLFVVSRRYN